MRENTSIMSSIITDTVVKANTATFVRCACTVFKDMMDVEFTPELKVDRQRPPVYVKGFTTVSHFFGTIHGEFMMSTDESTAAKITGVYWPDDSIDMVAKKRELYSSMMCEIVNVSAHQSLEGLVKAYGKLDLMPPAWIFGEYHMASYITGVGIINSLYGSIQCCLALNLAGFKGGL